jgi:hypothetical protein
MSATRARPGTTRRASRDFDHNVFVNCPFDKDYTTLLRPLLFTIIHLGLNPRIALESRNSGAPRIDKIVSLIRESAYAIHDLSRSKAIRKGELYRMNMPFELGLDVGCQKFSTRRRIAKKCLILDAESYRYQAALSDIAGSDIENHRNEPREVVVLVRHWLSTEARIKSAGSARIWDRFNDFVDENSADLQREGYLKNDLAKQPIADLLERMKAWCAGSST